MANRLRQFIESVVYAGLKPGGSRPESTSAAGQSRWRERLERFLAGGAAPADPLYLSRRTWQQKTKLAAIVAVPLIVLFGLTALAMTRMFMPAAPPPREATPAEIVQNLLPNIEKTADIHGNPDAEILEIRVDTSGGTRVMGLLKNKANRNISVELVLDFTDSRGSRVGAVSHAIMDAPPASSTPFSFPIEQSGAAYALVREVRTLR